MQNGQALNFPSHFINPREKGEEWIYQMVNAIYNEWGCQSIHSFQKGADRYRINSLYSLGKQPTDIYKPFFELSEDESSSYINLDFRPLPVIPKFRRITNNRFSKIDFTINAQAIDPFALDEKSDYEAEERANIRVRTILEELQLSSDVLGNGEVDQPKDDEELAIKMEFGYKHNEAIDLERRIDAVFTHERLREKLSVARDFGFNTGAYCLKVSTDPVTGKVEIRNVDIGELVVSPTKDPFFRDIWYVGETILMTIEEIRNRALATGVELSESELEDIAHKNAGRNGNPRYFNHTAVGAFRYDSCKVPVFDVEFLSCDRFYYEKRWDKRGNPVIGKVSKPGNKADRKYYKDDRTVVYRAKWIPGTKVLFDYGLKNDIPIRRAQSKWESMLSYKIVAPEFKDMETSPLVENLIPVADQICISWYKLQNVIARARPRGIMIEIGALEDISLGDAGEGGMKAIDVLDMFTQTGVLVYRKISLDGQASNYKPIEELDNGLGQEAAEHFAVIDNYVQKIRDLIGFNDITDGTTPDPKTLNGVASMAAEATNNALHHLFEAEKTLIEMVAEDVAIRVHDSIAWKANSPYQHVLAPDVIKSIKENRVKIHREFSIALEYGSDKFEREKLQTRIEKEQDAGRITLADAIAVERCRNTKQAEQILAYRIKKNMEQASAQKKQEVVANAQAQAQAAQVAEEEKRKTLQFAHQLEMEKIAREEQKETNLLVLEMTLRNNLADQPGRDNKIDIEKIRADATKEAARIKKAA
jgi:hypothetical protein